MGVDYIPTRDADKVVWMKNFAAQVGARWAAYGLSPADAENIAVVVGRFVEAYRLAVDPGTRTKPVVAAKDEARNAAEQLCRTYAMLIKPNRGVSTDDKLLLGIRPINPQRNKIEAPTSAPRLNIVGALVGSHTLRFADSNAMDRRAKPFGAANLQLFVHVGEREERVEPEAATLYGVFTKNPVGVSFASRDGGKVATYFARWCSRRGEPGPWSSPVRMHVAA